jgi:hypothetical protein
MPHSRRAIVCASAALTETATFAAPASAQSVAEFYKGKTIAILTGTRPGGSYDLYGRVVGEHPFRHIPGNPTINMEHMPRRRHRRQSSLRSGSAGRHQDPALAFDSARREAGAQGCAFRIGEIQWLGTFDAIAVTMASGTTRR